MDLLFMGFYQKCIDNIIFLGILRKDNVQHLTFFHTFVIYYC